MADTAFSKTGLPPPPRGYYGKFEDFSDWELLIGLGSVLLLYGLVATGAIWWLVQIGHLFGCLFG